jgi:hypothetical protein
MDTEVTDLEYATNLMRDIGEASDDMSAQSCVDVLEQLAALQSALRSTQSLLESRLITTMEQPIQAHGKVWIVTDDYADTWDHEFIAGRVADRLASDADGVMRTDVRQVAHDVAEQMRQLYVAPSTKVKVTPARAFDTSVAKAKRRRLKGKKVITMQVEEKES